jgi:hypothetical protein
MENANLTLRYAKVVAHSEMLANALVTSGDLKLIAKDQKIFFAMEEDLEKVDLKTLSETKVKLLEDVIALLGEDNSFYGEEESAILTYLAYLYREILVKNHTLNPSIHAKQLHDIAALGERQKDERRYKELDHRIQTLKHNAPAPSSYQFASYQKSLDALEKEKKDLSAKLFKI